MKRNRKQAKHLFLLCFAILMPLLASADVSVDVPNVVFEEDGICHDFEEDGIYYRIVDKENLAVEVTCKGDVPLEYPEEYSGVVTIPSTTTYNDTVYSVTSIGAGSFFGCSSLSGVNIPESVTIIDDAAFYNCSSLAAISIPGSVASIGAFAFCGCSSLTTTTIPETVTSIGMFAFASCTGELFVNCNIPSATDYGGAFWSGKFTKVTIGECVTSIGDYAFLACDRLAFITIPNSITYIGEGAFGGCGSLASINIPESITSIGYATFTECTSLTSIHIPESVTSIGDYAFEGCKNLTSITCKAVAPPSISSTTFRSVDTSIPVYVPMTSVTDYQAAEAWKHFTNIIGMDMDTQIETPELKHGDSEADVYDLNGRRITNTDNLKGGIYIINGRKVVN